MSCYLNDIAPAGSRGPVCSKAPPGPGTPWGSGLAPFGSGRGLFGFRLILHILRAGGEQVIDLAFGEPIHKGDGHIPIEQQALAGIRVGDIGELMLGNAKLFRQDCPVTLGLGQQNHKVGVVQNVLDLPAGQKVFHILR